ncbi:MAG TPA: GntR family transcriptional regulator, partial [Salinarimonas sp.]|nr:GntR family transcriptional regulator [Salinarimonas sp.]
MTADESEDSLVSRIVAIFEAELSQGRWQAGAKLPAVSELARDSGLNRGTLQYAIEKLVQKGVVRREKYHGYYVDDVRRMRGTETKTLYVWASQKIDEDPILNAWHEALQLRYIREEAQRRGWTLRLQTFNEEEIARLGEEFEERAAGADGVISLQAFPFAFRPRLETGQTPIMFWRDVYHMSGSSPGIAHDQPEGFALMTRRLIEMGHRNIVFLAQSPAFERVIYSMDETDMEREGRARFNGYAESLRAAGLVVNEEAANFRITDTESLRTYLETFKEATAIICGAGHISWKIVFMAQALGISVPGRLSVMAPGPAWIQEHGPKKSISGVGFDGA